ncbi:MAG: ABC transporter ATP-binding protein [bacterium]|nr:ABC transporter ATP-binding protein [bacterium]
MADILIEGLEKRYPKAREAAVKGIDIAVEPGEIFGLLGPNGAGKTTVISIIAGLLNATNGSVHVRGINTRTAGQGIREVIGVVPQDVALYQELTIRENLTYFARMYGLSGASLQSRVTACLTMAGLEDNADRLVRKCSGGMRRRANLVAGILHKPAILILDEPTVGIDAQSRNVIFESLRELNASGTTLVYTTHYMEEAQQFCSRIAIMDEGRIVATGAPTDLIGQHDDCANLEALFLALTGHRLRD